MESLIIQKGYNLRSDLDLLSKLESNFSKKRGTL